MSWYRRLQNFSQYIILKIANHAYFIPCRSILRHLIKVVFLNLYGSADPLAVSLLILVMIVCCVFFEVRTESLNIIYMGMQPTLNKFIKITPCCRTKKLIHHHHLALQPNTGPGLPFWGFVTITFLQGWIVSPAPNPQPRGPGIYDPRRQGGPAVPPRHWVPILVAFYDMHGLQWDYSLIPATTLEKKLVNFLNYFNSQQWFMEPNSTVSVSSFHHPPSYRLHSHSILIRRTSGHCLGTF
jgi:hypothetical protein